jgi:uncharacterized membrane protein YeaQ/YmgE (transglycosylase-associated protein family)
MSLRSRIVFVTSRCEIGRSTVLIVVRLPPERKMSETSGASQAFSSRYAGKGDSMHWILLIIVGALVGALGRLFHPGSDPMGWIVTILIGIASLVIAGLIFSSALLQFIVGVIVAVILVAIVGRFFGERRSVLT